MSDLEKDKRQANGQKEQEQTENKQHAGNDEQNGVQETLPAGGAADETPPADGAAADNATAEKKGSAPEALPGTADKDNSSGTDAGPKPKKKMSRRKKTVLISVLTVLVLLVSVVGVYAFRILYRPQDVLAPSTSISSNPYEDLMSQADLSMLDKNIINVLIAGVDYAPERETWGGKHAYHADVMIVLAINLEKNTVDMISLPRDTYAKIPGVQGKYKLNASLDCGGGYPEGMTKVCEAASWMLGGIPVDYYYAVTMPVLKDLVDAVGGLDYEVDVDFTMVGRSYKKGMQHMDGQAVLDYLRVRKHVEDGGDLNRINRQKNLLVALFRKMQQSNLIVKIPEILSAFDGKMATNTNLEQTAALAVFAYKLPSENIQMHSMDGPMHSIYNWNFCLTNQEKRVQLIKQVYGVDVPQYKEYAPSYCRKEWCDMRADVYIPAAEKLIAFADKKIEADGPLTTSPPPVTTAPATPRPTVTHTPVPATPTPSPTHTAPPSASPSASAPESGVQYGENVRNQLQTVKQALAGVRSARKAGNVKSYEQALDQLQASCSALAPMVGYGSISWSVPIKNEIEVDFR